MRRLHAVVDASRDPNAARDAWATVAFTYNGLKRLGVPQVSLDSFVPEFRQGMAARAAELGDVGASAPANWEAPLGTPDVHVAISVISPSSRPARSGRGARPSRTRAAAGRRGDLAPGLLPAADRTYVVRLQGRDRPAGDRRQRRFPARTRTSRRSRRASSCSATPTRRASCRRCRRRRCSAGTGRTSSSASCTRTSPRTAGTCARTRPTARRRRCWARRWSGAGRAARRCRSSPTRTTRRSAPIPSATTPSSTATTSRASSARSARTRGAPIRATRSTATATSTSACTG